MADDAALNIALAQEDELFLMSNLFPRHTGLPMTVWVQAKGHARHDARVKVNTIAGQRADVDSMAVVTVRPDPTLLHGKLSTGDFDLVSNWIILNREVIIDHWEGRADTMDLLERLKPLPT